MGSRRGRSEVAELEGEYKRGGGGGGVTGLHYCTVGVGGGGGGETVR